MRLKLLLGLFALGALAAALLEGGQPAREGAVAQPTAPGAPRTEEPGAADLRFVERLQRERISEKVIGEPFGARVAPQPAAAARAPAPPAAVPFPYRYAGQLSLPGGETRVYLTKGGELVLVKAGDVLEAQFKVIAVGEDALEVLHLASNVATLLQYSSLNADPAGARRASTRVAVVRP